LSLGT
jgi:hypothetical protein